MFGLFRIVYIWAIQDSVYLDIASAFHIYILGCYPELRVHDSEGHVEAVGHRPH